MKSKLSSFVLVVVAVASTTACSAEAEPVETAASQQTSASNCSSIPGCTERLGANDGPFYASMRAFDRGDGTSSWRLNIEYREAPNASFLPCSDFPRIPDIALVFVLGGDGERRSVSRPMKVSCPRSYGDNVSAQNSASFTTVEDEDPELWNTIFPAAPDGSRWFALRLAAHTETGWWDSDYGNDYRLVFSRNWTRPEMRAGIRSPGAAMP